MGFVRIFLVADPKFAKNPALSGNELIRLVFVASGADTDADDVGVEGEDVKATYADFLARNSSSRFCSCGVSGIVLLLCFSF